MPTISMFYGIVIYLYFFDDERHKLPLSMQGIRGRKPLSMASRLSRSTH